MELRLSFAVSAIGTLRDRCQLSFFFNDTATTEIYTLSLHDALPISSLTALARHFQPTASGGCFSRKKCVPSRNQSQVRIISCPGFGRKSAASSPIPRVMERPALWSREDRELPAIFFRIESSFWRFRAMRFSEDSNLFAGDSIAPEPTPGFATHGFEIGNYALPKHPPVRSDRGQVCTA